jgi:hypothetical protein
MSILSVLSRKLAMFHAGRNFNHQVQERKEKNHQLVTSGTEVSSFCVHQFCGSGSGIRGLLIPGSGMNKKSRSGSGMNIPDHIS